MISHAKSFSLSLLAFVASYHAVTAEPVDPPTILRSGLEGRSAKMRRELIGRFGGNEASEAAVARALKWLAAHQLENGGWSFDYRHTTECDGRCANHGTLDAKNAATAMALLPFLGAGQTHTEGRFKANVAKGLKRLVDDQQADGNFLERGGTMYSHGLCTLALCEAFGMTADESLEKPAQMAVDFIVAAQDPVGGGWRYAPRQPGDTSVTGWQILALQTARHVGLKVPDKTLESAAAFLRSTAAHDGAFYGYTAPGRRLATTSSGLFCRQLVRDMPAEPIWNAGVEFVAEKGPSISGTRANMYFNFFATQLMRHYKGDHWHKWNETMRNALVKNQVTDMASHAYGSWHFTGDHGADRGGRLYSTSLATLILEVYYRHTRRFVFEM